MWGMCGARISRHNLCQWTNRMTAGPSVPQVRYFYLATVLVVDADKEIDIKVNRKLYGCTISLSVYVGVGVGGLCVLCVCGGGGSGGWG